MLSPVEQIKERLSIDEVVSSYLKLEKSGGNWKARCPFHNEKTPSFYVSPSRQSYHCFGCNRGGDIFTFVQDIEGLDFPETLRLLASRAGIALASVSKEDLSKEKRLYAVLEIATRFFEHHLEREPEAKEYLKSRGLLDETISSFRVGFAPSDWRRLTTFLKGKGIKESEIEKAGLGIPGTKGMYDRFRSRIMFPIMDSQGRVVAFSGRIFGEASKDERNAKYVNSPETSLYIKSKILFGYDKAKRAMAEKNGSILVEGQMDLLMAHQAGDTNTVAVSGTALTEEHLHMIERFTDNLFMAFDADAAGLKAMRRGVSLALSQGMDVKIVALPEGKDPADYIQEDSKGWHEAVKNAEHIVSFLLNVLLSKKLEERALRKELGKDILPFVGEIGNKLDQSYFVKHIASKTGISEEDIRSSLPGKEKGTMPKEVPPVALASDVREQVEKKLAGLILLRKDAVAKETKKRFEEIIGSEFDAHIVRYGSPDALVFQAEMYFKDGLDVKQEAEELLMHLEKEILEERLRELLASLRHAEADGDAGKVEELLKECNDVSQRIHEIKKSRLQA